MASPIVGAIREQLLLLFLRLFVSFFSQFTTVLCNIVSVLTGRKTINGAP